MSNSETTQSMSPKKSRKKALNFDSFMMKLSKAVTPEASLSRDAKDVLDNMAKTILETWMDNARLLMRSKISTKKDTAKIHYITKTTAKGAVLQTLPTQTSDGLTKAVEARIHKALKEYNKTTKATPGKKQTTAHRAGLLISPSRVSAVLRGRVATFHVRKEVSILFAAALEQVFIEIFSIIGDKKPKRISPRLIFLAINDDQDVLDFIKQFNPFKSTIKKSGVVQRYPVTKNELNHREVNPELQETGEP